MITKFWMIYGVDSTCLSFCYASLQEAKDEAEHLAKLSHNVGKRVFVLEAVAYCLTPLMPVQWEALSSPPVEL